MKRSLFDGSSWSRHAPQGEPGTPHQQKPFGAAGELKPHRSLLPMVFHFRLSFSRSHSSFLSHRVLLWEYFGLVFVFLYFVSLLLHSWNLISLLSPDKTHTIFFVLIKSHFVSSALCLFIGESLIHNVFWHLIWLIPFAKHSVLLWKKERNHYHGKNKYSCGWDRRNSWKSFLTIWPSQLSTVYAWSWNIYKSVKHGGIFKKSQDFIPLHHKYSPSLVGTKGNQYWG